MLVVKFSTETTEAAAGMKMLAIGMLSSDNGQLKGSKRGEMSDDEAQRDHVCTGKSHTIRSSHETVIYMCQVDLNRYLDEKTYSLTLNQGLT